MPSSEIFQKTLGLLENSWWKLRKWALDTLATLVKHSKVIHLLGCSHEPTCA